ncbi:MAG: type II toxin-antitoxin system Phd/YefM family antitoxin [Thermoguttaceae bacterium]
MKTVSMLDFRNRAEQIIAQVQKGQEMVLTYRGKPVLRLQPMRDEEIAEDDPFYALDRHADAEGESLTNRQMDKTIYDA